VEFACVAPIMMLFTIGLIEMGRMTMVKQLLTNISREGSRLATLPGASSEGVRSQVEALLNGSHIQGASVTLSPELLSTDSAGNLVTVSISVESERVSWLPTPIFMAGKSISAATSMRRESL
jgi:Flp pilus assembly protein TadG